MNPVTPAQKREASLKLCHANLGAISKTASVPSYDRKNLKCGILHMSVGGFHRSHQALYIDNLMHQKPGNWMICAVGLMPQDAANIQALKEQDNLYTVLERSADKETACVVGSFGEIIHAVPNPKAVLERLQDPDIRIVSLTVTEKGYCYNEKGDLDLNHPSIKNDLAHPDAPQTALGYIVSGLARRRKLGVKPFTVMSCDNLPGNGHLTRKLVLQFSDQISHDLSKWIADNVSFPNAMVDRITPVTTPDIVQMAEEKFGIADGWPVVCEDFRQWVLEDDFCNGRPELESVGVQLVKDVEPYEKMKVRLLNGSHSALSYLSYLMGYRRVDIAMADPLISRFVRAYMDHDITPAVPSVPGIDLDTYKDKLIERFSNPAIGDQVQRLAEDGSQKIPNAILPCIRHQLETGGSIKFATLALAGWFRYLTGVDEQIKAIEIKDPRKDKMQSLVKVDPRDPTRILGLAEVFGTDLPINARFLKELGDALTSLHEKGAKETIDSWL